MKGKLIMAPEVDKLVGLDRSTLIRWSKEGKFPKRIRLSANRSAYVESEVMEWLEKAAERGSVE